jgi:hypothetical protein
LSKLSVECWLSLAFQWIHAMFPQDFF